jgi:hypothetical protein
MLANAMPENEEDDQPLPDDDLRRRPIPVSPTLAPSVVGARPIPTLQPIAPPSPVTIIPAAAPNVRAIPVGSGRPIVDADVPPETDQEEYAAPVATASTGRVIPVTPASTEDSGRRVSVGSPLTRAMTTGTAIPVSPSLSPSVASARPIPVMQAAEPAPALGSTEDLESRAARPRPIPMTAAAAPVGPEPGSTEDLEQRALAHAEHPMSAPIQTGVASLWTKAKNIHNPVLRVLGEIGAGGARALDTIGSIAAPGIAANIPGSTLNQKVKQAAEEKQEAQQAGIEKTEAETGEAKARTKALETPTEKEPANPESEVLHDLMTGADGQPRMNPDTQQPYTYLEAYRAAQQAKPSGTENEAKTIQTDKGVMQYNPETKRYDIPAGGAPVKSDDKDKDVSDYLASHNLADTPANREKARAAIAGRGKPEEGNYFPVPDGKGGTAGWVNPKTRHFVPISDVPGLPAVPSKNAGKENAAADAESFASKILNQAGGDPDKALKLFDQLSSNVTDPDQKRLGPQIRKAIRARRQINKPESALDKIISGDIEGGLNDLPPAPASR